MAHIQKVTIVGMKLWVLFLLVGFMLMFSPLSKASDLGKIGTVYTIAEENVIDVIHRDLNNWEKSGGVKRLQKHMVSQAKSFFKRPPSVLYYILDAPKNKTRLYDPTFTVKKNIYNNTHQLIAYKGQKVNPLDTVPFTEELIFINGDNKDQVKYAVKEYLKRKNDHRKPTKIILIRGNWDKIVNSKPFTQNNIYMYFDLHGTLSKKFELSYVPSLIKAINTPQGKRLEIKEVKIENNEKTKTK